MTLNKKAFFSASFYFPQFSRLIFFLLFIGVSLFYEIPEKISFRPQGIHAWRQSDCLSITLNYYKEGNGFFDPKIHNLSEDGTGRTVSDFPLIYYSVSSLWKVFGYHEYIYRLLVLIIALTGLFFLFLLMESLFKESFWALGITFLIYTSPLFVYYSNNFLSNIPALSFAFIAWYYLFRFYMKGTTGLLCLSMFFFLLGGLLKTTSLYSYVPVLFIFLTESTGLINYRKNRKIFSKPLKQSIPLLIVPILILIWYLWAFNYNERYNSGIFLIGIQPVWDLSYKEVLNVLHYIKVLWLGEYFHKSIQISAIIFYLLMLFSYKKINKIVYIILVLMGLGFILYLSFWFRVLDHHDYYLIDLLAFIVFILISFFYFLKINYKMIFNSLLFKVIFLLFLIYQAGYCSVRVNERYTGWRNKTHNEYFRPLETITPFLRSLGIERDDIVISIPDASINITLYLMDQKGWTNFNFPGKKASFSLIEEKIMLGARYLIVNDALAVDMDEYSSLIKRKMGSYGNIDIYELNETDNPWNLFIKIPDKYNL